MAHLRAGWLTDVTPLAWFAFYAAVAVAVTWPLAGHLRSTLLGSPSGDTGVYVWNLWIFRHELVEKGHLPFSTDHIFGYTGGADFSLHNFTPIAGLLATPLIPHVGVVAAFNILLMVMLTLTGVSVFALGKTVGLRNWSAALAGTMFIASPVITARETAHFSLVTAWSLPLFVLLFLRLMERPTLATAVLVGVDVAAAHYSDTYYGVYCLLIGVFVVAWRFVRIERRAPAPTCDARAIRIVDRTLVMVAVFLAWRLITGWTEVSIGSIRFSMKTLYTPTLLAVLLGATRVWLTFRPVARLHDPTDRLPVFIRLGGVSVATCLALMAPVLVGLVQRFFQGRLPETPLPWRSSPRGVDLLAYVVPNPNHAWFGRWTERWWLPPNADAFPELVASFSIVGLVCIGVAAWRRWLPSFWVAFTAFFGLLSLGPFIHIAGVNTTVIAPWAILRYVPVLGLARSPSRFAVLASLGLSLLLAFALEAWRRNSPRAWRRLAMPVLLLLALEGFPGPRHLYSANIPPVYQHLALTPKDGRILTLPTGIRDGVSSLGNFSASSLFFQTAHRHPIEGGYLSRVSPLRRTASARAPMLVALFALSDQETTLTDAEVEATRWSRDTFLAHSCVRHVVIDKDHASSRLRAFAIEALHLVPVMEDQHHQWLVPLAPPPCQKPRPFYESGNN